MRLVVALVSVPGVYVVLLAVGASGVAIAAILVYAVADAGLRYPGALKLLIPLTIGGLSVAYAVVAGIVSSLRPSVSVEPGIVLNMVAEPGLYRVIRDLCAAMDARPPHIVILSAWPTFHVMQGKLGVICAGESPRIVRGRILVLGHPLLAHLTVAQLRGVLAHELAHFTGLDTLYSSFVQPVYVGIGSTLDHIGGLRHRILSGNESPLTLLPSLLPSLILRAYIYGFHLVSVSLCRQRELRADVMSSLYTGGDTCASALRQVARLAGAFSIACDRQAANALLTAERRGSHLDRFAELLASDHDLLQDLERAAVNRKGAAREEHPPLLTRLRALSRTREPQPDLRPASELLTDFAAKTAALTATFEQLTGLSRQA